MDQKPSIQLSKLIMLALLVGYAITGTVAFVAGSLAGTSHVYSSSLQKERDSLVPLLVDEKFRFVHVVDDSYGHVTLSGEVANEADRLDLIAIVRKQFGEFLLRERTGAVLVRKR